MTIESPGDLKGLLAAGKIVGETLREMAAAVRPGVTTAEIDRLAGARLRRHGARPAPALTYGFPGVACISVNDEVCHGIAGARVIAPGDLVKLDLSAELAGYWADAALTVEAGASDPRRRRLCEVTRAAMQAGIAAARPGRRVSAIGRAIEDTVRKGGFRVIRELNGHGLGRSLHEEPSVPNYFEPRARAELREGLVITVEPHVSMGATRVYEGADGWTIKTRDGSVVANFEHTIVVGAAGPIVVTAV